MATKAQMSEEINDVLGTDMEFDRLLEEDITLLHELVMGGSLAEPQTKQFIKRHGKDQFDKQIDEWYPGKYATQLL